VNCRFLPRGGIRGDVTELTKDEAHREAIRRWHQLPDDERQTVLHAQVLAAGLAEELDFRTMGNRRRIIEAWLVEDIDPAVRDRPHRQPLVNQPLAIPSDPEETGHGGGRDGAEQAGS
jgi:hypothetical protein